MLIHRGATKKTGPAQAFGLERAVPARVLQPQSLTQALQFYGLELAEKHIKSLSKHPEITQEVITLLIIFKNTKQPWVIEAYFPRILHLSPERIESLIKFITQHPLVIEFQTPEYFGDLVSDEKHINIFESLIADFKEQKIVSEKKFYSIALDSSHLAESLKNLIDTLKRYKLYHPVDHFKLIFNSLDTAKALATENKLIDSTTLELSVYGGGRNDDRRYTKAKYLVKMLARHHKYGMEHSFHRLLLSFQAKYHRVCQALPYEELLKKSDRPKVKVVANFLYEHREIIQAIDSGTFNTLINSTTTGTLASVSELMRFIKECNPKLQFKQVKTLNFLINNPRGQVSQALIMKEIRDFTMANQNGDGLKGGVLDENIILYVFRTLMNEHSVTKHLELLRVLQNLIKDLDEQSFELMDDILQKLSNTVAILKNLNERVEFGLTNKIFRAVYQENKKDYSKVYEAASLLKHIEGYEANIKNKQHLLHGLCSLPERAIDVLLIVLELRISQIPITYQLFLALLKDMDSMDSAENNFKVIGRECIRLINILKKEKPLTYESALVIAENLERVVPLLELKDFLEANGLLIGKLLELLKVIDLKNYVTTLKHLTSHQIILTEEICQKLFSAKSACALIDFLVKTITPLTPNKLPLILQELLRQPQFIDRICVVVKAVFALEKDTYKTRYGKPNDFAEAVSSFMLELLDDLKSTKNPADTKLYKLHRVLEEEYSSLLFPIYNICDLWREPGVSALLVVYVVEAMCRYPDKASGAIKVAKTISEISLCTSTLYCIPEILPNADISLKFLSDKHDLSGSSGKNILASIEKSIPKELPSYPSRIAAILKHPERAPILLDILMKMELYNILTGKSGGSRCEKLFDQLHRINKFHKNSFTKETFDEECQKYFPNFFKEARLNLQQTDLVMDTRNIVMEYLGDEEKEVPQKPELPALI